MPPSGTGKQSGVPQFCWLTQTWFEEHGAASPHSSGASAPPSPVPPPELHPAATTMSNASGAPADNRLHIAADANTALSERCERACWNSGVFGV
jgi:hypothetical protein